MSAAFSTAGGDLHLSNEGQLELLRGMRQRGATLRTSVRGWSMAPFIHDMDVVTIATGLRSPPRVGDVLAVELSPDPRLVIHRVVARAQGGWLLRGDNSTVPDGVITQRQILGRVGRVERDGRVLHLGLGPERLLIAALSRTGALTCLVAAARWLRQTARR